GFAGTRRLHDQALPMALLQAFTHAHNGFYLVKPSGDFFADGDLVERDAVRALEVEIGEAVLRVEPVEFSVDLVLSVIPEIQIEAVAVEDHGTLTVHLLETVCI